jgi:ribosome-binding factor A
MPSRKRSERELRALCAELHEDDGVDPREDKRRAMLAERKVERKLQQLCKQVVRALHLALAELPEAETLVGATVREVEPAPHAGRLRAVVVVSDVERVADVRRIVERHAGWLRGEVAAAITRRKTPELVFEVVVEGGTHG